MDCARLIDAVLPDWFVSFPLFVYAVYRNNSASESKKGLYIGIFWGIFNLGGVVGASVSLGQNFNSTVSSGRILLFKLPLIRTRLGRNG